MKTLKNLIDAKKLSKKEQQAVKGGGTNNICYADCSADELNQPEMGGVHDEGQVV